MTDFPMTTNQKYLVLLLLLCDATAARSEDWNQWRGPQRTGAIIEDRTYLEHLPKAGLKPLWITATDIPSARSGGWSSPVVAGGRVPVHSSQSQSWFRQACQDAIPLPTSGEADWNDARGIRKLRAATTG